MASITQPLFHQAPKRLIKYITKPKRQSKNPLGPIQCTEIKPIVIISTDNKYSDFHFLLVRSIVIIVFISDLGFPQKGHADT